MLSFIWLVTVHKSGASMQMNENPTYIGLFGTRHG
jgi:hypothetical protein